MGDDVSKAFGAYPPIMSQMETEVGPGADDIQRHSLNSMSHTSHTPQTTFDAMLNGQMLTKSTA